MHTLRTRLTMPLLVVAGLALGLAAASAGVAYSMVQERRDVFCASCHTEPEAEFYRRSVDLASQAFDLAASHAQQEKAVLCIDCHGGAGLTLRVRTYLSLAVWDTIKFWSGRYEQPARLHGPLPDPNCVQCHQQSVAATGFENHFHNRLADEGAPRLPCASCHPSHVAGDPVSKFIIRRVVFPQCNACHRQAGKGPSDLR